MCECDSATFCFTLLISPHRLYTGIARRDIEGYYYPFHYDEMQNGVLTDKLCIRISG